MIFFNELLAFDNGAFIIRCMKTKALIIAGPTASGKSDFAHKLAKRINGAIINCDSVQIYRGIETISASPFAGIKTDAFNELDGVPYKLFSILPLSEHLSVADYLRLATDAFNEVIKMGKTPIFVGGTGYYINVLINGISAIPEVSEENRTKARDMVKNDIKAVYKLLSSDFVKMDPQRTARALEVFLETGKPLSDWQKLPRNGALVPDAYKILINPNRELLLKRIAKRVPEMVDGDALIEATNIIANNMEENRAIGTEQLCKMLRGAISKQDVVNNWITKTNQYAKRQLTWFRTQYDADLTINRVPNDDDIENLIKLLG